MDEVNDTVSKDVYPLPVILYGHPTGDRTVKVRERMAGLGVSFVEVDIDTDQDGARLVENATRNGRKTPLVVFGEQKYVLVDPSMQELDKTLKMSGYKVDSNEMDSV